MDFRGIKEFIKDSFGIIIVIIVVFIVAIYIVGLQQVVGPSMEPTLNDGDILLLSKLHYKVLDPKRNDVVALKYDGSKYLIKRVIGLPGEHIEYRDNKLYINGQAYEETLYDGMITENFKLEDLPDNYATIPEDMYLVLGDNRSNSLDSRDIGLISKEDLLGKAFIQIWPLNEIKLY